MKGREQIDTFLSRVHLKLRTFGPDYCWIGLKDNGKLIEIYSCPLQLWKVADQVVVGFAGEVVADYAINGKRIIGQDAFAFGYCREGNL